MHSQSMEMDILSLKSRFLDGWLLRHENIDICIEMIKISGGHFGKWPPFVLYGFIYARNGTTIFLFYNNTYLVIKIMIIR